MSLSFSKIVIAADHAGFELKEALKAFLVTSGYDVEDLGTDSKNSVDYPEYGRKAADFISQGGADAGILICGSGIGVSIAANRNPRVRAALCRSAEDAKLAREHNNANILAMGARQTDFETAQDIAAIFLSTDFAGGRHARRVEQLGEC